MELGPRAMQNCDSAWCALVRHGRIDAKRHGRIYSGHPRLWCCKAAKTWMPGTRPGIQTKDTASQNVIVGLTRNVMAGFIPAIHVLLVEMPLRRGCAGQAR